MAQELQSQGYLYTFSKSFFAKEETKTSNSQKHGSKKGIILILVADDHPHLIQGVEVDFNKDPKIKIVGACNSYDELLVSVTKLHPDVVLMDLRMPGHDKYNLQDFIAKLKKEANLRVAIFSNETGWARIHKCLEAGAQAYIEKAIAIGRLPEIIHRIYNEQDLLIFTAERLPDVQFSPRQKEILHFIADGKENDQIASLLEIDIKTVQSYVNEIKSKFAEAFNIHPIRPRSLLLLASKLGFGNRIL